MASFGETMSDQKNCRIFSKLILKWCFVMSILMGTYGLSLAGTTFDSVGIAAQEAYVSGDYDGAIVLLDSLAANPHVSSTVLYDLGNCFLQKGDLGRAILWYERALRKTPYDQDVRHNLAIAKARRQNGVVEIKGFFLARWLRALSGLLPVVVWALLSVLCFWVAAAMSAQSIKSGSWHLRGWIAGATGFLFLLAMILGAVRQHEEQRKDLAVVITQAVPVTIAPDSGSKLLARIESGEKVAIVDSLQEFYKVRLANLEQGWIPITAVEKI